MQQIRAGPRQAARYGPSLLHTIGPKFWGQYRATSDWQADEETLLHNLPPPTETRQACVVLEAI